MPLLETLMLDVGGSIAKALLTRWFNNNSLASDAASSVTDVLKGHLTDRLAEQRARHQFETIGEKVGESLLPLFTMDGAALDEGSKTAIALAVAETLNTISSELLARHHLEPAEISRQLLTDHPARSYHFSDTESRLYERIVSESCQYIVDIASQLPHFTERTLAEVLKRERHLIEIAEHIVQEVTRLRAQLNPQVEAATFEMDYRRTIIRKLDELELFGSGMSVTARKYSLDLAYVALSLEQQVLRPPQAHEERNSHLFADEHDRMPQVVRTIADVATVLAESPYLLLRGDAGSGKTTLLQWIAVQSAAQTFPQELAAWNGKVPFFIRLRQHARVDSESSSSEPCWPAPEAFPALIAPMIAGAMPQGWVHRQLQDGRAIVLVDGIDEVPAPLRPGVYSWLGDLVTTYPRARFIVTARPYAASKDDLPVQDRLKEAQVLPMTPSTIEIFITQWHRAVAANLTDKEEQQALTEAAAQLAKEVRSDLAKKQLASNPLLCAMLCALNRERHQQLPSNRVALYEACCELLIERRDQERHIPLTDYPANVLSYEQKNLLLSELAYWLVRNGQTDEQIDTVDEWMERRLRKMIGVQDSIQGADARLLFTERSGILREPVKGVVDFTHRTFQEFLAAKAIVDENDIPLLVKNAHDDQWREVVLLTVGQAPRKMRESLVEGLLKRAETRKRVRSRLYLLAAACTLVAREEMNIDIRSRVAQGLATLVPLKSEEEVEAMATAGTLAIPYLAPRFEYSSQIAAACAQALLQIGNTEALNALQDYTHDDTPEVITALILGLREVADKPAYGQHFLSHIENYTASPATFELLPFLSHLTSLRLGNRLSYLPQVTDLSFLTQLPSLTSLMLYGLPQMTDLSFLTQLPSLTSLTLYDLPQVTDLSFLTQLPSLTSLGLNDLTQVTDLSFLTQLPSLTSLVSYNLPQVTDLSIPTQLPSLTSLGLYNLPQGTDLSVLTQLPSLTSLELHNLPQEIDLSVLTQLPSLTSLMLDNLPQVTSLSFLTQLPSLTSLELYNLPQVSDLPFLTQLPSLTSLMLYDLPQVSDLSFLTQLPSLTSLMLYDLPQVSDLSFLEHIDSLKTIAIGSLAPTCVFPQNMLQRIRIRRR